MCGCIWCDSLYTLIVSAWVGFSSIIYIMSMADLGSQNGLIKIIIKFSGQLLQESLGQLKRIYFQDCLQFMMGTVGGLLNNMFVDTQ